MPGEREEALLKEFYAARDKYADLLKQIAEIRLPGTIDPVAAKCSVGEVCHGGEFLQRKDQVVNPIKT